jgi:hypothetical protein
VMTHDKDLKNRIRARMQKTGESYTAARRQFLEQRPPQALFEFSTPPPVAPPAVLEFALAEVSGAAGASRHSWSSLGRFLGIVALVAIAGSTSRLFELRQQARGQRAAAKVVRQLGGAIRYDWQGRQGALATQADDWNVDPPAPGGRTARARLAARTRGRRVLPGDQGGHALRLGSQ